jgi:uncharacterized RDD family membrane protein YckC
MSWYYAENNQRLGPIDENVFLTLVREGRITSGTLIWRPGMPNWVAYSELPHPTEIASPGDAVCAECGRPFSLDEMVSYEGRFICAQCKPLFFQKVKEGAILPATRIYAGFWIRFVAAFLDGIILNVFNFLVGNVLELVGVSSAVIGLFVTLGSFLLYQIFFVGRWNATPGKMALKLKVIRSDGSSVGYGLAAGRCFSWMLSWLILCIGFIIAGFDEEKRALHDRICDTRVVRE